MGRIYKSSWPKGNVKPPYWPIADIDVRRNCDRMGVKHPEAVYPFWERAGTVANSIINKNSWQLSGTSPAWDSLGFASGTDYLGRAAQWKSTQASHFMAFNTGDAQNNKGILEWSTDPTPPSSTPTLFFQRNTSTVRWYHAGTYDSGYTISNNVDMTTADVYNHNTWQRSYYNGVFFEETNDEERFIADQFYVGIGFNGQFTGTIYILYYFDGLLSNTDIARIHSEPYFALTQPVIPIYFDVGAVGDVTATMNLGTANFNGQSIQQNILSLMALGQVNYTGQTFNTEKKLDLAITNGTINFSGQTLKSSISISIGLGEVDFVGQTLGVSIVTPGAVEVAFQAGTLNFTGQGLLQSIELKTNAGTINYTGQSLGLEKLKIVNFSQGIVEFAGQTFTATSIGDVLAAISSGTLRFAGQEFTVVGLGSSGMRRLAVSQYVHAQFLRPEAIRDIFTRRLEEEPKTEQPVLQEQVERIVDIETDLIRKERDEIRQLEGQLAKLKQNAARQRRRDKILAAERRIHALQEEQEHMEWYLKLLEEDEILLFVI